MFSIEQGPFKLISVVQKLDCSRSEDFTCPASKMEHLRQKSVRWTLTMYLQQYEVNDSLTIRINKKSIFRSYKIIIYLNKRLFFLIRKRVFGLIGFRYRIKCGAKVSRFSKWVFLIWDLKKKILAFVRD